MRKELIALLLLVIVVVAFWFFTRPKEEQVICPAVCKYGCITGTAQCREPPPVCPSTCKLGCKPSTTECIPEVIIPAQKSIRECGILATNSSLAQDVASEGNCFIIESDNLVLDCGWHKITGGNRTDSYAIKINGRTNVTIENCLISNYSSGISIDSSSNVRVSSIRVENSTKSGISVTSSHDVYIESVSASNNMGTGISLLSSKNTVFTQNLLFYNSIGLSAEHSNFSRFFDNYICENNIVDMTCNDVAVTDERSNSCGESLCDIIGCASCDVSPLHTHNPSEEIPSSEEGEGAS